MAEYEQTKTFTIGGAVVTVGGAGAYGLREHNEDYGEPFDSNLCVKYHTSAIPDYDGWTFYSGVSATDYHVAYTHDKIIDNYNGIKVTVPRYIKRAEFIPYSAKTSEGVDWWRYNELIFPREPLVDKQIVGAYVLPKSAIRDGLYVYARAYGEDILDATLSGMVSADMEYYDLSYNYNSYYGGSYTFNHTDYTQVKNVTAGNSEGGYFVPTAGKNIELVRDCKFYGNKNNNKPFGYGTLANSGYVMTAKNCEFDGVYHLNIARMENCTGDNIKFLYGAVDSAGQPYTEMPTTLYNCNITADMPRIGEMKNCNVSSIHPEVLYPTRIYNSYFVFNNLNGNTDKFSAYNSFISGGIGRGYFVNCEIITPYGENSLNLTNCTVNGRYVANQVVEYN